MDMVGNGIGLTVHFMAAASQPHSIGEEKKNEIENKICVSITETVPRKRAKIISS